VDIRSRLYVIPITVILMKKPLWYDVREPARTIPIGTEPKYQSDAFGCVRRDERKVALYGVQTKVICFMRVRSKDSCQQRIANTVYLNTCYESVHEHRQIMAEKYLSQPNRCFVPDDHGFTDIIQIKALLIVSRLCCEEPFVSQRL